MKNIIAALFIASFGIVSCNNAAEEKTTTETAAPAPETQPEPVAAAKPIDPVCEMELEDTWTEYTIYNNDTVKFCSETCKKAFEGNPSKYAAKLVTNK